MKMELANVYNLETAIASFILAAIYVAVLIKAYYGSRFAFVVVVSGLMLASNIFGIIVVAANFKIIPAYVKNATSYPTSIYVWIVI